MTLMKPHMDVIDRGWFVNFTPGSPADPYPSAGNPMGTGGIGVEVPTYIRHINFHSEVVTADADTTVKVSALKNGLPGTGTVLLEATHLISSTGVFKVDTEGYGLLLPSDDLYVCLHSTSTGTKGGKLSARANWTVLSEPVGLTSTPVNRNVTVMDDTFPRLIGSTNPGGGASVFYPVGRSNGDGNVVTADRTLVIWFMYFTCDVTTPDIVNAKMNQTLYKNGLSQGNVSLNTNTLGSKKSSTRGPFYIGAGDEWSVGWGFSGASSAAVNNLHGYIIGEWI